jgi:hypothetical protein
LFGQRCFKTDDDDEEERGERDERKERSRRLGDDPLTLPPGLEEAKNKRLSAQKRA